MLQGGLLLAPPPAVSGYAEVDRQNRHQTSSLLEREQRLAIIARITKRNYNMATNVMKEVRALRTECFQIRLSVISIGGVPLAEPLAYWRWRYGLVPF
ncbi:unnamed protein product [Urochloa humidicola]